MKVKHVEQLYKLLEKAMNLLDQDLDNLCLEDLAQSTMMKKNITDSLSKITTILIEISKNNMEDQELENFPDLTNIAILQEYINRVKPGL